jgi:hypothetical protein
MIFFPFTSARLMLSLSRTPMFRICSVGSMKVRPTYWLRMMPKAKGMPDCWLKPMAAGVPLSGTGQTRSASAGASLASSTPIWRRVS